jgi:predicted membrane-bound mannosyltransferase
MSGVGECHLGSGFKSLIWLLLYYDCLVFLSELMGSYWPLVSAAHSRSYFFFFISIISILFYYVRLNLDSCMYLN